MSGLTFNRFGSFPNSVWERGPGSSSFLKPQQGAIFGYGKQSFQGGIPKRSLGTSATRI